MSLKIIGAGIGRTGTQSLKLALVELGFGKCFHMDELIFENPEKASFWQDVKAGKKVDWDRFFEGYQSSVDIPTFVYYKELMEKFPDAKVILTVRDADGWYKSFGDTIITKSKPGFTEIVSTMFRLPFDKRLRQRLNVLKFAGSYLPIFFPKGFENKEEAIRFFNNWNQSVLDFVPKERLLVYNVKEGWEPLCKFLNVPVPQKPFPRSNSTAEFIARKL